MGYGTKSGHGYGNNRKGNSKLYGVYAKIGKDRYRKHTWPIPKGEADDFAAMLKRSDVKGLDVSRVSVKRLKTATIAKAVKEAKEMSRSAPLPPSMKRLLGRKT